MQLKLEMVGQKRLDLFQERFRKPFSGSGRGIRYQDVNVFWDYDTLYVLTLLYFVENMQNIQNDIEMCQE